MQKRTDRPSVPSARVASENVHLTRRQVIGGAAGVVALGALTAGAAVLATQDGSSHGGSSTKSGDFSVLDVPQDAVFTTEDCEYLESSDGCIALSATASLPYGTMLWSTDDEVAACLLPSDTSNPLTKLGLLSLTSGSYETVLDHAIAADEGFQIYDVRATGASIAWVEANILDNLWRIYHADVDGFSIGQPVLVYEGDNEFTMPSIAATRTHSYWQLVPNVSGLGSAYTSSVMRAPIGAGPESVQTLLEAPGKMACNLTGGPRGVTCAPRVKSSSTYYALTQIDDASGEIIDELILPASMKPTTIGYGNSGFTFAFENIYSSTNGISNLGTYTPLAKPTEDLATAYEAATASMLEKSKDGSLTPEQIDEATEQSLQTVADLYSAEPWFRFPRTPLASPAWCGNWFMIRSTTVIAGVDLVEHRYFTIEADGTNQGYGEFLASQGSLGRVVTYANVDYTPLEGTPIKECAVRIWDAI